MSKKQRRDSEKRTTAAGEVELDETSLDEVSGGLPAVQKVRGSKLRTDYNTLLGDGSVLPSVEHKVNKASPL
jgi:hypothetical protein